MKSKNIILGVILLLLFSTTIFAGTVKIGLIIDGSQKETNFHKPFFQAVKNYYADINNNGGINNNMFEVLEYNVKEDLSLAKSTFNKLKEQGVSVIIGGETNIALELMPLAKKHQIPYFPMSLSEKLDDPSNEFVFLSGLTYKDQFFSILPFIKRDTDWADLMFRNKWYHMIYRSALLYDPTIVDKETLDEFKKLAKKNKIRLHAIHEFPKTKKAILNLLHSLREKNVKYIICHLDRQDMVALLKGIQNFSLEDDDTFIYSTYLCASETVVRAGGTPSKFLHIFSPFAKWNDPDTPGLTRVKALNKKYNPKYTFQPDFYIHGFIVADVLKQAMELIRSHDGISLKNSLESTELETYKISAPMDYAPKKRKPTTMLRTYRPIPQQGKFEMLSDWRDPEEEAGWEKQRKKLAKQTKKLKKGKKKKK